MLSHKYLERLHRSDGIILDDIGYVQHNADEMEVLFTFIAERYRRLGIDISAKCLHELLDQLRAKNTRAG